MTALGAPTFTVVIPAYNAEATIEAAVRSALAQTRADYEVVVVDDGSTDGTAHRVRPFESDPRVRIVQQENRGLAAARNTGIEAGQGRYVSLLDADDLWLPDYLAVMGAALDADPGAALAYSDAWVMDDRTRRIARVSKMAAQRPPRRPPHDPTELLALLLRRNFVFVLTTFRRSAVTELGGFDARLRACEDYDLWLRLAAAGHRFTRPPGRHAVYRRRAGSLSTDGLSMATHLRAVYAKVAQDPGVPPELRREAEKTMASCDARIAALSGGSDAALALHKVRRGLRDAVARLMWRSSPPPEVARAFPDLSAV